MRQEWFLNIRVCWKEEIYFKICFCQHQEEWRTLFARWHHIDMFTVPQASRAEVFVSVFGWWSRYDPMNEIYVPTTLLFLHLTGASRDCRDDKRSVDIIAQT